ncbi:hypothetical protein C4J97_3527 [Pseudomonas orientalis]|nr:hypothetical protein C4J97_3527 [Pseudomonas orientalis]
MSVTKLDVWTRFSEAALNAIISSKPGIAPGEAAERAADYADEMMLRWEDKLADIQSIKVNPSRNTSERR